MKSKIPFIAFILMILMVVPPTVSARDIVVGNGSGSNSTIQEAVDGAETGDVIIVKSGTYVENINVSKAGLTIKPETNGNVIIRPADNVATVRITNVSITISDLNIVGSVFVSNALLGNGEYYSNNMCHITNNTIENGGIVVVPEGSGIIISGNKILDGTGIDVTCCGRYIQVSNNIISDCSFGISTKDGQYMSVYDNKINNCTTGIEISEAGYDIENNEITNCGIGVQIYEIGGATLVGNKITYCTDCGVEAEGYLGTNYNNYFNNTVNVRFGEYSDIVAWNTTLARGTNIIGGSYIGGNYWAKPDGTGFSQTAVDANGDGIADSAYRISSNNVDYLPLTAKYNMIRPDANFTSNVTSGTAPLVVLFTDTSTGGVPTSWYWDTGDGIYSKHAMNATHTFTKAGIYTVSLTVENRAGSDTETKINYINVTNPAIPDPVKPDVVLPVANFELSAIEGYAPLFVRFTDLSQNATSIMWDVNNDGAIEATTSVFTHAYNSTGTYTVKLIAINSNGTTSKTATITVKEDDGKKSSGGSSTGGGGGGSPEPARNVQVKELSQAYVTNDKAIKFDFTKNATCVVYVSFDSKKTAGKTTTIVEQLKGKSTLVPKLPAGEVYKSFNVWVGNSGFATSSNIENPVICFKIEKDWIKNKNIDSASITLNRYDKKWEQLPVKFSGEDDKYLYFTASVPKYESFAITGIPKETVKEVETGIAGKNATDEGIQNNATDNGIQTEQKELMSGFGICYAVGILCLFVRIRK